MMCWGASSSTESTNETRTRKVGARTPSSGWGQNLLVHGISATSPTDSQRLSRRACSLVRHEQQRVQPHRVEYRRRVVEGLPQFVLVCMATCLMHHRLDKSSKDRSDPLFRLLDAQIGKTAYAGDWHVSVWSSTPSMWSRISKMRSMAEWKNSSWTFVERWC
eukprot:5524695-Amphidinium_carterae.2